MHNFLLTSTGDCQLLRHLESLRAWQRVDAGFTTEEGLVPQGLDATAPVRQTTSIPPYTRDVWNQR